MPERKAVVHNNLGLPRSIIRENIENGAAAVIFVTNENPTDSFPSGYHLIYVYLPDKKDADALYQKGGWDEPYPNYAGTGKDIYYTCPSGQENDPEYRVRKMYSDLLSIGIEVDRA